MRQKIHHVLSTTIAVICATTALMALVSNKAFDPIYESIVSETPVCTAPPQVPQDCTFAGDTIRLVRYDLRERMDRELMAFCYMHSSTMLAIKRANRYFPVIEPILHEEGIPDDLKYLAVVESNLDSRAKSRAGAVGLWQFMAATGRQYGLEVNQNIDERYHVEKSTRAACRYLREAYNRYGDWMSVAASYNGGQGRISSQLKKQMANNAMDLWLVEETSRYMFRLLAAKAILSEPQRYGFLLRCEQLYPPIVCQYDTVKTSIVNLVQYAKKQGISYAQLKDFNSWLRGETLQNANHRTYIISIPTREAMYYNPKRTKPHNPRWVVD